MDNTEMTTAAKANSVLTLLANTPDGVIRDADTILEDLMHDVESEVSGTAKEIIDIWKHSQDRQSVEELFEAFTGSSFENYLDRCLEDSTKKNRFVYRDIVRIGTHYWAEERTLIPEGKGEPLNDVYLGDDEDEIADRFDEAQTEYFDIEEFISDLSYQFRDEVAKAYNYRADEIKMLTFGDFALTDDERKNVPWGKESCGCFVNDIKI